MLFSSLHTAQLFATDVAQGPGVSQDILKLLTNAGLAIPDYAAVANDAPGNPAGHGFLNQRSMPASFVYDGQPSATLLSGWTKQQKPSIAQTDRTIYETTWSEPRDGLVATWHVEVFTRWPAAEFKWIFTNTGATAAKPLTEVEALDLDAPWQTRSVWLVRSTGGMAGNLSEANLGFAITKEALGTATVSGLGGRSSDKDLPFFVVHADGPEEGIFVGVGWSGQWQANLAVVGGKELKVRAGMPGMNLSLPPGEHIVSPSILLGAYSGPPITGSNLLRRMLYAEYVPLLGGSKPLPPVSWNSWFILENRISEATLKSQAGVAAQAGVEYFCIDAGWFNGGFPHGVGNWTVDQTKFPHGLGPIGDYVAQKGMKLGLWFEPERAGPGVQIRREHPEWVHGDVVDLGNQAARDWIFDMMKGFIDAGHVRWIRWDFNASPLSAWDQADAPDQHGLTQIRHVMGLYELLDRLMRAYPDLLVEGCASGGRRIDLETVRRSHTFWKSDETGLMPVLRFHETGGNVFLPGGLLNVNVLPRNIVYDMQSVFGGPLGLRCDWTKLGTADVQQIRAQIDLYKEIRPLLNEDYYPLFIQQRDQSGWIGWQFHSPSRGEGFILLMRPKDSPYASAQISLQGLDADAIYSVVPLEGIGKGQEGTGKKLHESFLLEMPPESSAIYRYKTK